jgi:hypothetical protein
MANGTLAVSQLEMLSQSGTGIITITPPATNTNRAITLPDAAGAIVVSGTTPSLNGITFPATQVASAGANTLDDYEEGTFTPFVRGEVDAGTTTYNTGSTYGRYVKIGQWVFIELAVVWATSTGATGAFQVGGLPFTSQNFTGHFPAVTVGYYNYGSNSGWGSIFQSGLVLPNTTVAQIYYSTSTTMAAVSSGVLNTTGGNIYLSTMYLTA